MKRLTYLFLAISTLICSCATFDEPAIEENINLSDLYASFDEDTRTYVENDKYLRWHEDDRLTAFYGNTRNRQYKFNGATGDNNGSFSHVPSGDLETGNSFDRIYAVYPYDETASITDDGKISLTLPAVQTYAENSFGRGANTMLAVTENKEDTFLAFKNACGYLKLKFYSADGATIKSIEVKGNSEEKIAGAATATISFGEAPQLTMADDATTTITIDCGDGVALGTSEDAATEFWVVIPETTFESGITITATDSKGVIFEKSTTKAVVIERNAIQPMAALEAEFVKIQPNNEIWYTATEKVEPYDKTAFGATYQSNEWDEATGEGVITFDGDFTYIGAEAFSNCTSLTSINIPDSVRYLLDCAFYNCTSLTNVTIGDNVMEIGVAVFENCTSLTSVTIGDSVRTIGNNAFTGCSNLVKFEGKFAEDNGRCLIMDKIIIAYANASGTEYTIPDSVTEIGYYAFESCTSLESIIIPDSVTKIRYNAFESCTSLTSVTIGDSVTGIGDNAFESCTSLTSVSIGDSVTEIGTYAFKSCTSLKSITIPDKVTSIDYRAFYDCSSLTSVYCKAKTPPTASNLFNNRNTSVIKVYVPAESTSAYRSAQYWKDCPDINVIIVAYDFEKGEIVTEESSEIWYTNGSKTKSTKPNKTDAFGANIVSNIYDAEKDCWVITFDGDVTTIGDRAFSECNITSIIIPDSVTSIGNGAFSRCSSLTSITIPDSVMSIEESAFSYCTCLRSITIGKGVTSIGYNVFSECTGELIINCNIPSVDSTSGVFSGSKFTSVIIGDGVTNIGASAFYRCSSLTSVTFSDSVTSIGKSAFSGCSSLNSANIGNGVTSIGDYAFYECKSLTSVTIPDSVTSIGESAFSTCSSLKSVNITDLSSWCKIDFKDISSCPLNYYANLYLNNELVTELVIPSDITEIKSYAFYSCSSLTSVTIPESVTKIGNYAFRNCRNLTSVYCKAVTPPTGEAYMFNWYSDSPNLKIYVPTASVSEYKKGAWSNFNRLIVGYDFEDDETTPTEPGKNENVGYDTVII